MTPRLPLLALAFSSASCASSAPPAPVVAAAAPRPSLVLKLAPELTPLTLACSTVETPGNGLDDDCDGSIDGQPREAALTLSWTTAPGSEVDISLRDASGQPLEPSAEALSSACAGPSATTRSRVFARAPTEPGELILTAKPCAPAGGAPAANIAVALSVGEPSGSRTFLVSARPDQPIALGAYVAP